jgi:hypothetical protein
MVIPQIWVLWPPFGLKLAFRRICHVIFLGLSEFMAPSDVDSHGEMIYGSGGFGLKHDTPEIKSTVGCLSQPKGRP